MDKAGKSHIRVSRGIEADIWTREESYQGKQGGIVADIWTREEQMF